MVHKAKHMVHSFRGLLADGTQDEINLERQNVNLAYQIKKFQIITKAPFTNSDEHVVKIYKSEQATIDGVIDFTTGSLLGVAIISNTTTGYTYPIIPVIIFDREIFTQNIYVTHWSDTGSDACNYYIELEEVPVGAATLMQLKLATARTQIGAKMGA